MGLSPTPKKKMIYFMASEEGMEEVFVVQRNGSVFCSKELKKHGRLSNCLFVCKLMEGMKS